MRRNLYHKLLGAFIVLQTTSALAADIQGKVVQVTDQDVVISVDFAKLPMIGDQVEIFVTVPNLGEALVASGHVTRIEGQDQVHAKVDQSSGTVAAGQQVKFTSTGRRPSPATEPPPPEVDQTPEPSAVPPVEAPATPSTIRGLPTDLTSALQGPTDTTRQVTRVVTQAIPQLHLSGHPVDDEIAERTLENMLFQLDPNKVWFLEADVAGFRQRRYALDDLLRQGDLRLVYEVFQRLLQRMREHAGLAQQLLDSQHDFAADESLIIDPRQTQYPMDPVALREIWRKWIKYHLLTHKAAGANSQEARDRTAKILSDLLQRMHRINDDDLLNGAMDYLAAAYDPNTTYMSAREFAEQNMLLNRELTGIGASLKAIEGYITVDRVIPDAPADRDGRLKVGDRIIAIRQGENDPWTDVIGQELQKVVALVRGIQHSKVQLRVIPQGSFESYVYAIRRDRVDIAYLASTILAGQHLPRESTAKIGYIYLESFYGDMAGRRAGRREGRQDYRSCARDIRPILEQFEQQGIDVVVLDLRRNGGGLLPEAVDTTALFVGGAAVLQSRDREGNVTQHASEHVEPGWLGPVVVLTSRFTGGGAELLAAAIQDYQHGVVVGDPSTFGSGTIGNFYDVGQAVYGQQNSQPLGYVQVTTSKFYRPNGQSPQLRGIVPDVVLPSPMAEMEMGEAFKRYPLAADAVDPIVHTGFGYGADAQLKQWLLDRSNQRRATSLYFQRLSEWQEKRRQSPAGQVVRLQETAFLADRNANSFAGSDEQPSVPGISHVSLDGYLQEALSIAMDYTSRARFDAAERFYARGAFQEALDHYRSVVSLDPGNRTGHYKLAWALSTCPEKRWRNGSQAVVHARRAGELADWSSWQYRLVLSMAEAEAGRFQDASGNLNRALSAAPSEQREKYQYLRPRYSSGRAVPAKSETTSGLP